MNRELDMLPQIRECNEIWMVKADVMWSEAPPMVRWSLWAQVEPERTVWWCVGGKPSQWNWVQNCGSPAPCHS